MAKAARFEIAPGGFAAGLFDAEGKPTQLAGTHPDHLLIHFGLELEETTPRDLVFELPAGLGFDGSAVPPCSRQVVAAEEECPAQSRVGSLELAFSGGPRGELPLFEMETAPGQPVSIAGPSSFHLPVEIELRPDFGTTVSLTGLNSLAIEEGRLELWGVPADHQVETSIPRKALLSAPAACGPMSFGFRTRSEEEEAPWLSATVETPPLSGCEELGFEPSLGLGLSEPIVDSPTGLRVELGVAEDGDADGRASAPIKDVTVAMPPGLSLSPGGAAALSICSDAQIGLGNNAEAHCPESARIGSIEFFSPGIEGALSGALYLGESQAGQPPRVFVVLSAVGMNLKFAGALTSGGGSGAISTSLRGLPPLSVNRIVMNFNGGPTALFVTPLTCGPISAVASFTPYGGGPSREVPAGATITAPPFSQCSNPPPFSPQLLTSVSTRKAGHSVSISSAIRRLPGEQLPGKLSLTMPGGLSARLGTVKACPEANVEAASCPATSQVGSALAQIGSGPDTVAMPGNLYLTGPYHGAPMGVLIELSAKVGPFDFGTIALRGTTELNPTNGSLVVSTSSLPSSVEGISIRFRLIQLSMDRPGFLRNPTGCAPRTIAATLQSQEGAVAKLSSPFRTVGCSHLAFKPKMGMELFGKRQLRLHGRPGLRTRVRLRPGDANLRTLEMSMPPALGFAIGGVKEICSTKDAIDAECPPGSRIGRVRSGTALLSQPLKGSLFVAQPGGDGLPDIWFVLKGGGISMSMKGREVKRNGRLTLELARLPDVPLTSMVMTLQPGGAFSLLINPCVEGKRRHLTAPVAIRAQNGARRALDVPVRMKARCG